MFPVPKSIPASMQKEVDKLKKCKSKEICVKQAYDLLKKRFKGYLLNTWIRIYELPNRNLDKIWNKKMLLCTHLNWLLKILLVKSGHFKETDIELKWTLVFFVSPHQYVIIRIGKKLLRVDPWGSKHGVEFGKVAYGFGSK